jgi:hypothetical protein
MILCYVFYVGTWKSTYINKDIFNNSLSLDALNRLHHRAVRIGFAEITNTLETLQLRRYIASHGVFYRLYNGECSEELFDLILPSPFLHKSTRAALRSYQFIVSIQSCTKKFGNTFLCHTSKK